ncbi:MAG: hypothetical protein KA796_07430 [Chryseobacterium sp.]|nr:hypothetical protein [Chryseobacterium sp.]MBP7499680.1 hypothetical protein [Chryseobacterium sp.]
MSENLHIILIITAFVILISWTIFDLVRINKKLKSKRLEDKKEGYKDLKTSGNENIFNDTIEIILNIFKKIF